MWGTLEITFREDRRLSELRKAPAVSADGVGSRACNAHARQHKLAVDTKGDFFKGGIE